MAITWKIDPAHSEIQFKVKHLMITTVTGYFRNFDLKDQPLHHHILPAG